MHNNPGQGKICASLHGTSPRPPTAASLIARPPLTLAAAAFGTHRWRQAIPWHFTTHMPWHMRNCPLRSWARAALLTALALKLRVVYERPAPVSRSRSTMRRGSRPRARWKSSALLPNLLAAAATGSHGRRTGSSLSQAVGVVLLSAPSRPARARCQ